MAIAAIIMGGIVLSVVSICACIVIGERDGHRHTETMKQLEYDAKLLSTQRPT